MKSNKKKESPCERLSELIIQDMFNPKKTTISDQMEVDILAEKCSEQAKNEEKNACREFGLKLFNAHRNPDAVTANDFKDIIIAGINCSRK